MRGNPGLRSDLNIAHNLMQLEGCVS